MIKVNHFSQTRFRLKTIAGRVPGVAKDFWQNRRCSHANHRILVTRHCGKHSSMFRDFLAWIEREVPELAERMEFQHLPYTLSNAKADRISAHVSWINDTLDMWSPSGYGQACKLLQACRQRGISCINPVDRIRNVGKARGASLMRSVGVRTPMAISLVGQTAVCPDQLVAAGIGFPCLIREERGHGQLSEFVANADQLKKIDLSRYRLPIAAEFIDTRDPDDGLYRKYRYVSAGEVGIPRHLITDSQWDVRPHRRVKTQPVLAQETSYIEHPDPHHDLLQAARDALGMDVAGFDYSFTPQGELVIWEANPYLDMNYPKHISEGQLGQAVTRTFAAVAHLYLRAAQVEIPAVVQRQLQGVATFDSLKGAEACNQ